MLELAKLVYEALIGKRPSALARVAAFMLAPGIVLGAALSTVEGGTWSLNLAKPIALMQLKTEISNQGDTRARDGVAIIMEPVASEYQLLIDAPPARVWSSLDPLSAKSNRDRLSLTAAGFSARPPFWGVGDPVTFVVEGKVSEKILLPAGAVRADEWRLTSHRSDSVVAGALLACVFGFGISLAVGLPRTDSKQHAAGEKRATPNEDEII